MQASEGGSAGIPPKSAGGQKLRELEGENFAREDATEVGGPDGNRTRVFALKARLPSH